MTKLSKQSGFTIVEVMVASALLGGLALGAMSLFESQQKNANYLEFVAKKEQLRISLIAQVFMDLQHCKCLFPSATAESTEISGTSKSIGRYSNACVPVPPLINSDGMDGIKMNSYALKKITTDATGSVMGDFEILISSMKEVTGMKERGIRLRVGLKFTPSGFQGCSMNYNETSQYSRNTYPLNVPRNNVAQTLPTIPFRHTFCALSGIRDSGGDNDYEDCWIESDLNNGTFILKGKRGDDAVGSGDPPMKCEMTCL